MAASMVFTHETVNGPINKLICTWTSAAGGGVAGTTTFAINGFLIKGLTNPDDTDAPTNLYDIVITNPDGVNVLGGTVDDLVDRATATSEEITFNFTEGGHPVVADLLTVTVAAAGDSKKGVLTLYYLKQASV